MNRRYVNARVQRGSMKPRRLNLMQFLRTEAQGQHDRAVAEHVALGNFSPRRDKVQPR